MYLNFDNCFSSSNDDDDPLMLLLVKVARNLLVKQLVFMIQHYRAVLSSNKLHLVKVVQGYEAEIFFSKSLSSEVSEAKLRYFIIHVTQSFYSSCRVSK